MIKLSVFDNSTERADKWLSDALGTPRSIVKKWFDEQTILFNDTHLKASRKLLKRDEITITAEYIYSRKPIDEIIPSKGLLCIAYEDSDLLIVDKAQGLVSHPGAGNWEDTLVNQLANYSPALLQLPRCGLIHRLDKLTSGLLLIAKTESSYQTLVQMMADRTIKRMYLAVVWGEVIGRGLINQPLGRDPNNRQRMAIRHDGKTAITHYRAVSSNQSASLLQLSLETGRTHQIRVHVSSMGHSIVGDTTYRQGFKQNTAKPYKATLDKLQGQLLHAYCLKFTHPVSKKILKVTSPLPHYFENSIKEFGLNMVKY